MHRQNHIKIKMYNLSQLLELFKCRSGTFLWFLACLLAWLVDWL